MPPEIESTLRFGAEGNLVGTLARVADGRAADVGLLLTTVGAMPRSGPYRLNVELARRFAAAGVASLRYDLSGAGDSAQPAEPRPRGEQWVADTQAAMDLMERELGVHRFMLVGVSEGADVACLTGAADARLQAVVMFDPCLYPTARAHLRGLRHRLHGAGIAATATAMWRALARRVRGGRVARVRAGPVHRRASIPTLPEFAAGLGKMVAQGTRVLIVVSGSFPYDHNYAGQTADNLRPFGLAGKVDSDFLPEADHVLLGRAGRDRLVARSLAFAREVFGAATLPLPSVSPPGEPAPGRPHAPRESAPLAA
jgi:dienelactone hydrolase